MNHEINPQMNQGMNPQMNQGMMNQGMIPQMNQQMNKAMMNEEKMGMKDESIMEIVDALNITLANLNILYVKLHNFHWNVVGMGFFDMHAKTQELYEHVAEMLDGVAEKIRMYGYNPLASMQSYLKVGTIKEAPSENINATTVANIIEEDFEEMLIGLKELDEIAKDTLDECLINMIADSMCFFEKNIWIMNAYKTR